MTNHTPASNREDAEPSAIVEGLYRWTIDTVNMGPLRERPILGTGTAPLLAPSEAVAAIQAWSDRQTNEAYISKAVIAEALKDEETEGYGPKYTRFRNARNELRQEIRRKLNVDTVEDNE